ncbi:MAG TPA: hypothetical protein VFC19_07790 [Candidatus Limnocylindrales bacterium]|nr:hypothetical protein [Candidatus Limnocylindrales bacterium]
MAAAAGLGLVVVFTAVQLSLIDPAWSTQQWVLAVVLPSAALIAMVTGGLALWLRWFNGTTGPPGRGRYRARHAWQARRWIARTSPIMGEPEAVAARIP